MPSTLMETLGADFSVLYAHSPSSGDQIAIGVILLDPVANRLQVRLRQDWDTTIRDQDSSFFEELETAIAEQTLVLGGKGALEYLLRGFNDVTAYEPQKILVSIYEDTLNRLYAKWIKVPIRPFVTHLPALSLRSAAGKFLENLDVQELGWIEIPRSAKLRLHDGQFIVRIQGTSMQPIVADGSLAIFDGVLKGGTRNGRFVLVEESGGVTGSSYTLKRYTSKLASFEGSEDTAQRESIVLHPVNKMDHKIITLTHDDDRYAIIGFFVRALNPSLGAGIFDES